MRWWLDSLEDPPSAILEIGCGNGILSKALVMMGYDVTGLDIVPGPYNRDGYHFVQHNLHQGPLPFQDDEFDCCISFDCIEHLEPKWARSLIYEMERVTRGGNIIGTAACFKSSILHETIENKEWWMEMISQTCSKEMEYTLFQQPVGDTVLFKTKKETEL